MVGRGFGRDVDTAGLGLPDGLDSVAGGHVLEVDVPTGELGHQQIPDDVHVF